MATKKKSEETAVEAPAPNPIDILAQAISAALAQNRPPEKKTAYNRVAVTPWTAKPGEKKEKLKRKMYQHGLLIDEDFVHPSTVKLLNQLQIGTYLNNTVRVTKTKNGGIDFTYPMRTAAQKLRLVNQFGITNLDSLLTKCIEEAGSAKDDE